MFSNNHWVGYSINNTFRIFIQNRMRITHLECDVIG